MKYFFFISIIYFVFCFAVSAQLQGETTQARKIDEYEESNIGEASARVDNLFIHLKDGERGLIRFQAKTRNRIIVQLKPNLKALHFRKYDLSRVSFAIVTGERYVTEYWVVPRQGELPKCEGCVVIRAHDFQELEKFFRPQGKK